MTSRAVRVWLVAVAGVTLFLPPVSVRAEPPRIPVLLDTDIGSSPDDAFALALVLAGPEFELRGVTTVGKAAEDRAWIVCRFLSHSGRRGIPVAWGRDPQPESRIDAEIQYRRHPAVIFDRTARPVKEPAIELLYNRLKAEPGKLTLIATGPLTNVARLIDRHPDCKPWIRKIVWMGGSIRAGYDGKPPAVAEWNARSDPKAAQVVFESGVPLAVAPLDATAGLKLTERPRRRIFDACTRLTFQLQALYQLSGESDPVLFDAAVVALALDSRLLKTERLHLTVDRKGFTRAGRGKPNATVATEVKTDDFIRWCADRIASYGEKKLPKPPGNLSRLVPRGGLPVRVHAFEDYETDIERRWWLSGKLETTDTPPGSARACRAVVTQDFDGRMGDTTTAYGAVIFNPVPGPPMAKRTRLTFRYRLQGTDTLRVQLYSLSNGYHRYLSLRGLPQGRWETATVDMTEMRRPDGSGGPLSENERIDDIQFYVDPRAELVIDDVVLYEAAPDAEKRPFPRWVIFTGWFDTGRQGQEWPGDFEIVSHDPPRTWKAARSVVDKKSGRPWIRVSLRGRRPLPDLTRVRFHYRLKGADDLRIVLADSTTDRTAEAALDGLTVGEWREESVDFKSSTDRATALQAADEVRFLLPEGAELLIDDLLVYAPGER